VTNPTRTTNRLHFTDLSHTRFEDLAMHLVYRLHRWEDIHHDGRTGSDDGVDIRAVQRLEDQSVRSWFVQCRRYGTASAATLKKAVDDALAKAGNAPDVLLVIIACDVTLDARTDYEQYARERGIQTPLLWPASTLEPKLYSDHPDLLFVFFDITLPRKGAILKVEVSEVRRESDGIVFRVRIRNEGDKAAEKYYWHFMVPVGSVSGGLRTSEGDRFTPVDEITLDDGLRYRHYRGYVIPPLYPGRAFGLALFKISRPAQGTQLSVPVHWQFATEDGDFPAKKRTGLVTIDIGPASPEEQ
jgi:Restriction endonuclease